MTEKDQTEYKLVLRGLKREDYPDIKRIMDRVYRNMGGAWQPHEYGALIDQFPEKQICIVENMDIQYSQSAVFTPSDFAFPHDAIAAEATPNTEMTLMVDLDLDLLKELRQQGSVRNLQSRRKELYEIVWKSKPGGPQG